MENNTTNQDRETDLQFAGFIASLAAGAFQHLGKIANPVTGKIERDLQAAKATIDLLSILKKKTQGNLSREEEKLLDSYVTNLQLNYVEESNKKEEEPRPEPEKKEESDQKKEKTGPVEDTSEVKDQSKVKWSKTYSEEEQDEKSDKE